MSKKEAQLRLDHMKQTHQYFCFTGYDGFVTAEELLQIVLNRPVSFDEAVEFISDNQ